MVIEMKAKNKGTPKSLPGTPAGRDKGGKFQPKKSFSPKAGGGGGGGKPQTPQGKFGNKGTPGKQFGSNDAKPGKQFGGKPGQQAQQQQKPPQGISAKFKKGPKPEENGNKKQDVLKQLDTKSKGNFKQKQGGGKQKKNKNTNRYHRFQEQLSKKVRTPQSCARALKAEQELTSSQGRLLKVTLPDPVITAELVKGWSSSVEEVLFAKPVEPRYFTIVLQAGANLKKEIEKLTKVTCGSGKLTVKEYDPTELGHTGGLAKALKNPAETIDPYTLYATNLPEASNKGDLEKLFPGSIVLNPKKHNPKMGTPSKFTFITYETADAALTSFKENFNKRVEGKSIVMRFKRLSPGELRRVQEADEAKAKSLLVQTQAAAVTEAEKPAKKQKQPPQQQVAKAKPVKVEPKEEEESDDEDDDDEEMVIGEEDSDEEGAEMDDDDDDDDEEDEDEDDDDDDDDE